MMTLFLLVIGLLCFHHCSCCPTGYTREVTENAQCSASTCAGVIAYGAGTEYNYKIQPSTPFACNNNEFGDPIDGTNKECCSQSPTITISCGDTVNPYKSSSDDQLFFKLTTTRFLDIQFSTCHSGFDTKLHVFNAAGNVFSDDYCTSDGETGDDCGGDTCGTTETNRERFTIPSLLPDVYYIQVQSFANGASGNYQLSVTCTENDFGFRHLGCYGDDQNSRAMSYSVGNPYTIKQCYETCKSGNYLYFGVQWGDECWCSNDYASSTKYGTSAGCSSTCTNTPQTGGRTNRCEHPGTGGDEANDLYKINTLSPTKTPSKTPTTTPTTSAPTSHPTLTPTKTPTQAPSQPTSTPTKAPTTIPSIIPSVSPSKNPSLTPTNIPTTKPTNRPSEIPTNSPSKMPTKTETNIPTVRGKQETGAAGETSGLDDIILILIILIAVFACCIMVVLTMYFYRKKKKREDAVAKFGIDSIELGPTSPNSEGDGNMNTNMNTSANLARVQSMSGTSMVSDNNMSYEAKQNAMNMVGSPVSMNGNGMANGSFNQNNLMMNNPMMNIPIQLYDPNAMNAMNAMNGSFRGSVTQEQMNQMSQMNKQMQEMAANMNMNMMQQNFGINPNMAQFYMNQMNTSYNNGENASAQPGADPSYQPNIQNTAGGLPNMMPLPAQPNNYQQ